MADSHHQELDQDYPAAREDNLIFQSRVDALLAAKNYSRGFEEGFKKGFDEGRQQKLVECLLEALCLRGIELMPEAIAALRCLDNVELPNFTVALNAESAEDFLRRSGLR